ncbi:TPA: hypothetical protein UM350_000513 [Stenotrophomonas maltophilia]|nr:hypothetical protein EGY09_19395 [Stenotrophomonas maltophilia]EKT4104897.1 hypothetical protein [Stenotrophomonas maltophilia]EMB2832921.1 hypothetical protein [Stenotrophomonas maltophilia]KUJ04534.1 hypothetical protein AR275_23880 [Stenotrophomonas maltophilia]MBA0229215.1 hypothetical protein [Stenotrophomonas maltophilia]
MRRLNSTQGVEPRRHPADGPELGERSMLNLIAATAPDQFSSFVVDLDEAISRWMSAAENESPGCLEQELSRMHALKSVTSALGSCRIADACENLADALRSGEAIGSVRLRGCALAISAKRLLGRTTGQSLTGGR